MSNPKPTPPAVGGSPGRDLRLAMLGMIPGNGHPYSWSAIINGYDPVAMAPCPYPTIPQYLGAQPLEKVKVPGARVTHIWTDNLDEARLVAKASLIPHVVDRPEDVIGQVDAVFISTDDGYEHVRRARPFVEAGLAVFVDKPLAISIPDLQTFIDWEKRRRPHPFLQRCALPSRPRFLGDRSGQVRRAALDDQHLDQVLGKLRHPRGAVDLSHARPRLHLRPDGEPAPEIHRRPDPPLGPGSRSPFPSFTTVPAASRSTAPPPMVRSAGATPTSLFAAKWSPSSILCAAESNPILSPKPSN